jgi:8-oxo-dGTP diphosphatase
MLKTIDVACLVLRNLQGQFLCVQRSEKMKMAGLWEFPGGKVEVAETAQEALLREIKEELSLDLKENGEELQSVVHDYGEVRIRLIPFFYQAKDEISFSLNEHKAYRWSVIEDMDLLDWAPADIPVLQQLKKRF